MKKYLIIGTALTALALPAPAYAKHDKAPPATEQTVETATNKIAERVFNEAEKAIIEEYFGIPVAKDAEDYTKKSNGKGHKGLPPGLAKKDQLPPGLAMQLEKNGHLPPGLEKRDLPDDLLKRLPPALPGTRRIMVGHDIVLVDDTTNLVLDIIKTALETR